MEEAIYLKDSYVREWEAKITETTNGIYIVLDRTAFYPVGGGQPWDTGTIECNGEVYNVVFVGRFGNKISHEVDREGLKCGDRVRCRINWERRYKLMRMHTAAHIIAQIFYRKTGALITGGQLGEDRSRIDFSAEGISREKLKEFEEEANRVAEAGLEVSFSFIPRGEAMKSPELFRLEKGFPEEIKEVRIVRIGDFDVQADGGTHVKNTKEIGRIKITGFENKGKKNKRIYYSLDALFPKI